MKRGQYKESEIINKIKLNLSRDSSQRAKENAAIEYSDWFYVERSHDLSLANQKLCGQRTIDITGIDVNTAIKVQTSVVRAYTIADRMLAAHETIQHHHLIASGQINQQLFSQAKNLSINASQVPTAESINSRHGGKVVGTSQVGVDQEGTSLAVNKAISDVKAFPNYNNSYNTLGDTRAINLASSGVKDSDLSKFCSVIDSYTFNLEALYLNNNAIGNGGIAKLIPAIKGSKYTMYMQIENGQSVYPPRIVAEDLRFLKYKYDPSNPKFITQNVVFLNLCNNNIGDRGAKTIADALTSGKLQSTKEIDLHGNSITKTGYGYFVEALENPKTQDITITLASTVKDMQKVGNEAMKAMYDFVVKGLRYAVQEHVKNNAGTKWDINRVRSDQEIDKWKDCKDTVFNIGMGYLAGLVKCASTSPSKDPYSMFVCSSVQGGLEGIAQPETLHCITDLNELAGFYHVGNEEDNYSLVGVTHDSCDIM